MLEAFVTIGEPEEQGAGAEVPTASITAEVEEDSYGKFTIGPLDRGYGITLGNPLRRVLLSSVPGAAVTWVRIDGVLHEYATVPHVKEQVLDMMQRVKSISLRPLSDRPGRMRLEVTGPGEVYAGDITASADFEIVNPELHLATLDSSEAQLAVEFNVEQGVGYAPAEQHNGLPIGTLPVDAMFSPVRRVNYTVEHTRVGQVTDYELLVLEVWTNGTINPTEAIKKGAQILVDQFFLFTGVGASGTGAGTSPSVALSIPADVYNMPLERLDLTARTLNCLKRTGIHKIGEILERTQAELLHIRNFGEKSLEELIDRLQEKDIPVPEGSQEEPEEEETLKLTEAEEE